MFEMPYKRLPHTVTMEDPSEGVLIANGLFLRGKFREAFDVFEQTLDEWPEMHVEILAACYDHYESLTDRSRYALYQSRHFDFPIWDGDSVLDIGSGHIPFPKATHLADISLSDGEVGRAGKAFKRRDGLPVFECPVEDMPFEDNSFDFAYCSHVLEHSTDPEKACRELMRVARRGYIETPARAKDCFLNMARVSHHLWAVEHIHGTLVFSEYTKDDKKGLMSDVLMDMTAHPESPREKAFAALIYLRAPQVNTMFMWEDSFKVEVRSANDIFVAVKESVAPLRRAVEQGVPTQNPSRLPGCVLLSDTAAPGVRQEGGGREKLRLVQVHTFYPAYLEWFYGRYPKLAEASYEAQVRALVDDGFSGIHMLAPHLKDYDYDSHLIIANNPNTQAAWLSERGYPLPKGDWVRHIAMMQLEELHPDVVYLTEPITFDGSFLHMLSFTPRLTLGWRAADIPQGTDWRGFDVMLSSLAALRQEAERIGAREGVDFSPGVPEFLMPQAVPDEQRSDIVFCGQWTRGQHERRNAMLQTVARAASAKGYSCDMHLSGEVHTLTPEVATYARPALYGRAMHEALARGRIAFDGRGRIGTPSGGAMKDLAGRESANMRIFEATGSGAFLLTEHYDNLSKYFDIGREIETFRDDKEMVEKLGYYLAHPEEREEIAQRGRERCRSEHSMAQKAKLFDTIVRERLARQTEQPAEAACAEECATKPTG